MRRLLFTNQKIEGDFLIKAFFNSDSKRPNRIDVERKVPFTFNDSQVEETAILRFKDNHEPGEVYKSKIIFANLKFNECSYYSGYVTLPTYENDPLPPSKYKKNPTLQTIWKDPLKNEDIREFMTLFNNFHLFIKKDNIVPYEQSFLQYFAQEIYEAYKKEKENVLHSQNKSEIHSRLIGGFYGR